MPFWLILADREEGFFRNICEYNMSKTSLSIFREFMILKINRSSINNDAFIWFLNKIMFLSIVREFSRQHWKERYTPLSKSLFQHKTRTPTHYKYS